MVVLWLIGIILLLYIYIHFNEQSRLIDKMFPGPFRIPIIGTLPVNSLSPKNLINAGRALIQASDHKPFRIWYFNKPYLLIPDAKTAKIILSQSKYTDKADFYNALVPWFGNHFVGKGEEWLRFRKHDVNGFRTNALSSYVDVFDKNCKILCQTLQNFAGKEPINLYKFIHMYSLDNLCGSTMGYNLQTQANPDSPYFHAIDKMIDVYFWKTVLVVLKLEWAFYFTSLYRLQKKAAKVLREFSKGIIDSKRDPEFLKKLRKYNLVMDDDNNNDDNNNNNMNNTSTDKDEKRPIVDLATSYVLSKKFTDEEIQMEIEMAISAGHGTITNGLGFIFYNLAKYQDVQEKVYQEVVSILGDSDNSPTLEELNEMKYTEQVIKETLRVFSVIPMIGRHVNEDVYLNENQFIPKNTDVILLLTLIHRDPDVWPNPHVFDPERFSPENVKKRDSYAYMAWSAGPRSCIGYRYAVIEFKTTIARMIRQFKVFLSDNPEDKLKFMMTVFLTSANGFKLRLVKRK